MLPATAGLRKVCDVLVAPEYCAAVKTFMDLASIPERMAHDDIRTPLNGVIELPFAIGEQNAIHPEEQNFDEIPVAGIRALRECMSENDVLKLSDEL